MTLQQVLQALVFASPKPISVSELAAALKGAGESCEGAEAQAFCGTTAGEVEKLMREMREELDRNVDPFRLVEGANGWAFVTHPDYAPWVRQLYPEAKPTRLSGPALETLAIIAYRQPVTRSDIEAVRGVAVDGVMQVLLDRGLVKIAGRADLPGRPLLYSTTSYFLEHFGLRSTGELPNADELRRLDLPKAPVGDEKGGKKKDRKMEGIEDVATSPELPLGEASAKSEVAQSAPESGGGVEGVSAVQNEVVATEPVSEPREVYVEPAVSEERSEVRVEEAKPEAEVSKPEATQAHPPKHPPEPEASKGQESGSSDDDEFEIIVGDWVPREED